MQHSLELLIPYYFPAFIWVVSSENNIFLFLKKKEKKKEEVILQNQVPVNRDRKVQWGWGLNVENKWTE